MLELFLVRKTSGLECNSLQSLALCAISKIQPKIQKLLIYTKDADRWLAQHCFCLLHGNKHCMPEEPSFRIIPFCSSVPRGCAGMKIGVGLHTEAP